MKYSSQNLSNSILTNPTHEEADTGDSELCSREVFIEMSGDFVSYFGCFIAFVSLEEELGLSDLDYGKFCHHKECTTREDNQDDNNSQSGVHKFEKHYIYKDIVFNSSRMQAVSCTLVTVASFFRNSRTHSNPWR